MSHPVGSASYAFRIEDDVLFPQLIYPLKILPILQWEDSIKLSPVSMRNA